MPRRLISFDPGQYYHLYNRGVNRENIFIEERNYWYFLFNLERYLLPITDLIAYCLMPNHYHLLVYIRETSEVFKTWEVSTAMMRLSVSYTKTINIHYDRVGPLFQGAFQAKFVDSEVYLGHLIGYIHLNPVESGLVEKPEEWIYSSFHDYKNLDPLEIIRRDTFRDLGGLS